ncbi:MAG: molybdenum cofactor guanylyltransferase [Nevskiaceae bacterium]|nr:MAG: molybdenum cofactor guanylyltransferase [Nevskiaceae bacterium]TBR73422.1 MAG: molybdenum cofactor guanylyltransferase [Nevskiaceae bacterium]
MGGIDKGLAELCGRPMVEYAIEALRGQAGTLLISANRNIPHYARYGLLVVRDQLPDFAGPLAGIASLMAATPAAWLLIAPCDSPRLPTGLGPRLWRAVSTAGADIGVAHDGARMEPTFALLRCRLRPALEAALAKGERKVARWYASQRTVCVDFSDCPQAFLNINSPSQRDGFATQAGGPHPA